MARKSEARKRPLIERSVTDANFAHTVSLLGPVAAWAEAVAEGYKIEFNDQNMIHIPVEIALAFAKERLNEQTPLGEASREAFRMLALFRAAHNGIDPPETQADGAGLFVKEPEQVSV